MPSAPPYFSTRRYFPALDGLRGLAILLVILHNADVYGNVSGVLWPAALLSHAGWTGVELFFVLSGFLITNNLLDTQQAGNYFESFFARRTLRIFPLYYGTLFVALIVAPHFVAQDPVIAASRVHQVWLWTFMANWAEPFGKAVHGFPHFWSLSVEEQFYLVWPFLLRRRNPPAVWTICATLIVAAFCIRCAMLLIGAPSEAIYMLTVCRMDALAAGAAAAALLRIPAAVSVLHRHSDRLWISGLALGAIGAVVTDTYSLYGHGTFTIGYTILSACFALLVLGAIAAPSRINTPYQKLLAFAPLRSIGKYSYAMYVFHMLIILSIGPAILAQLKPVTQFYPPLYALVITALSYIAALVSYHCYEKHFLKLKGRFKPRSTLLSGTAA
jgi:peptidoglycan/LPS O-acetylase OafA/YrhL